MQTFLVISIMIAAVAAPTLAARARDPRRALARTLVFLLGAAAVYLVLLTKIYARYYLPGAPP